MALEGRRTADGARKDDVMAARRTRRRRRPRWGYDNLPIEVWSRSLGCRRRDHVELAGGREPEKHVSTVGEPLAES